MNSEEAVSNILTPEQFEELERLAGIGWSKRQIALYFEIHLTKFLHEYERHDLVPGTIRYHYDRGVLIFAAKVDTKLSAAAETGNLTAIQIYKKESLNNKLRDFKERLLNGDI